MAATSNVTSAFIDLATYDELERYLYGGDDAIAYFVRETRKATWFSQVPVALTQEQTAGFGSTFSYKISRAGDYLLQVWLRATISAVTAAGGVSLAWCRNLMHNLIEECSISFNDLVAARFDSYHLDFWAAFTVPAGKQNGYDNMIGNFADLTSPDTALAAQTLNLPLPLFFTRNSGVALPTAALPYNEMKLTFKTRNWTELLLSFTTGGASAPANATIASTNGTAPSLSNVQCWANYAIVSNEERTRMGQNPRDILIEQVQTAPLQTFAPLTNPNPSYDIRFSHAVKTLFFGCMNTTTGSSNDRSNYTTAQRYWSGVAGSAIVEGTAAADPIATTSLVYENTLRLAAMGSDYYSLVQPFYQPNAVIPQETGYHMYSYSLDFLALDPMGSTNYGKLTNVSARPVPSASATTNAAGNGSAIAGNGVAQTWSFVLTSVSNNVIRVSGGALGFPVL